MSTDLIAPIGEVTKEDRAELSKAFIKEQKTRINSFRVTIENEGTTTYLEKTSNTKIERHVILRERNDIQDVSVDEIEFNFDFMGDLEDLDLDLDLDLDDLEEEEQELEPVENSEVIKAWKTKYSKDNNVPAELVEEFYSSYDDIDYDSNDTEDPYFELNSKKRTSNINIDIITPEEENKYINGKEVVYDYLRYSEKKGELTKCVSGEGKYLEEATLLMNKALNFDKSKENQVKSDVSFDRGRTVTIINYVKDEEQSQVIIDMFTNETIKEIYIDNSTGLKIDIDYSDPKGENNLIPVRAILPGLRYVREILTSTSNKERNEFKFSPHIKTVVLPKVKSFKSFLELDYVEHADYEIVDIPNRLIDLVEREMMQVPKSDVIGHDAETTGLKARKWLSNPDLCVSHSFSWRDNQSIIVPIRMKYRQNIRPEEAYEILRPVFEEQNILAHNGSADVRFLLPDGIDLNLVEDTMHLIRCVMPFIIKAGDAKGLNRSLASLCKRAFGLDMIDLNRYIFKPSGTEFDFSILNDEYLIYYGCPDTDLMRRLWKGLRPKLDPKREYSYKQLIAYSKAMATLSSYPGIGISEDNMRASRQVALNTINKIQKMLYEITDETPETLKLSSPAQISNYVFNKLGAPTEQAKVTATGQLSADKHVMSRLANIELAKPSGIFKETADIYDTDGKIIVSHKDLNKTKYPFCRLHRILADQTKDVTAFYNGILNNSLEGIYYPDFRVAQTDTYRDTDRAQITKDSIKHFLGRYSEEYEYIAMDYATEEVRIAANRSTDMALIRMLQDPEADAHTEVAAEMYDIEPYEVDSNIRGGVKACNFGIIYGIRVPSLTKQIKRTEYPTEEELAEIQPIYDLYVYKRAEMLSTLEISRDNVRETGWVENDVGAWMLYPQVIDVDDYIAKVFDFTDPEPPVAIFDDERKWKLMGMLMNRSGNFPIQSLAAFQLKDSYIKFRELLIDNDFIGKVFVPLTIHDEVGIVYHKSVDPYQLFSLVHEAFYSEMDYINKPKELMAPLYIGVGFGTTWGNSKSDEAELPVRLQEEILAEYKSGTHKKLGMKDDYGKHFSDRIKSFAVRRSAELLEDMIENRVFQRHIMNDRLQRFYFVSKKMGEQFGTIKTRENPVTGKKERYNDLDMYIDLICEYQGYTREEFTIEDGPEVEEVKEKENGNITEFYFEPKLHEIVTYRETFLQVDVRNLVPTTLKSLVQYLWTLHDPKNSYHSKEVMFVVGMKNGIRDLRPVEGLKILGVPMDFSDVINHIIYTGKYEGNSSMVMLQTEPQKPLLLFDHTNKYIIFDTFKAQQFNPDTIKDISEIIELNKSSHPSIPYQVWLTNENGYIPTQIYTDGIPNSLLENIQSLYQKYGYVCE